VSRQKPYYKIVGPGILVVDPKLLLKRPAVKKQMKAARRVLGEQ